ncbi:MAG TPA: D-erythronate dehydrogenase [Longimicrobiales bacterium]
MTVLVTGGAGFLGARLVAALLDPASDLPPDARIVSVDLAPCPVDHPRVTSHVISLVDAELDALVTDDVRVVFHLAAVVSGQAEAEFDLGMQVNVDGTRRLLEACRRRGHAPRVVFASTIAVFGGVLPPLVPDDWVVAPESSYGAGKLIAETLVVEYTRRRFVDGIVCRLPTVAIRPGRPNAAVSSFVSGIVREPLAGVDTVLPVPPDTRIWLCSPGTAVRNLVHAAKVPAGALGRRPVVNLPGISVTAAEMLDSLERVAGPEVRARVRHEPDPRIMAIVRTWPGAFELERPLHLGFTVDESIDAVIRQYVASVQ